MTVCPEPASAPDAFRRIAQELEWLAEDARAEEQSAVARALRDRDAKGRGARRVAKIGEMSGGSLPRGARSPTRWASPTA